MVITNGGGADEFDFATLKQGFIDLNAGAHDQNIGIFDAIRIHGLGIKNV